MIPGPKKRSGTSCRYAQGPEWGKLEPRKFGARGTTAICPERPGSTPRQIRRSCSCGRAHAAFDSSPGTGSTLTAVDDGVADDEPDEVEIVTPEGEEPLPGAVAFARAPGEAGEEHATDAVRTAVRTAATSASAGELRGITRRIGNTAV
jgi:hypothetical protein